MANRTFDKVQTLGKGRVKMSAIISPNGTAAPTLTKGMGITSVTRLSQGVYRLTFTDQFYDLSDIQVTTMEASGNTRVTAQIKAYSLTNKTVDIGVYQTGAGATGSAQARALQLPLADARILTSNHFDTIANAGGIAASNSTPIFEPTNGATDPSARLDWAATVTNTIGWYVTTPPDCGPGAPTLQLLAKMSGATDTPVITVAAFQGVGGTNLGAATAAITGTTLTQYSLALSGGLTYPSPLALTLTPGSHGTNALYLYGAWLEYPPVTELIDLATNSSNQIHIEVMYKNSMPSLG